MPHRSVILAPFALLFLVTLVGGQVNRVDADGIVVDTSTSLPVPGVSVTYGKSFPKGSVTDEQGHYFIPNLPRDANLGTRMAGYQPASAPATAAKIEVTPGTLTVQVNEEGTTDTRVPKIEIRQGDKVLTKCTADPCGQLVVTVIDIVGQKALICAPDHDSKEIELKGVTLVTTLTKHEGAGCPALPSPSPAPSPSRSPSSSPSASPSAVPTASPSPTASP